jgi:hypothetical protein
MDGLTLLHRAEVAGLRLEVTGNALNITGPKKAEPLVRLLAKYKTQVLEVLANGGLRKLRETRKTAPESPLEDLPQSVEEEARRDRCEERAAILEFDWGLPRDEAEAIARREMADGSYETAQATSPYATELTALRANCPAHVPKDGSRCSDGAILKYYTGPQPARAPVDLDDLIVAER